MTAAGPPPDPGPTPGAGPRAPRTPALAVTTRRPPEATDPTVPAAYPAARPLRDGNPNAAPSPYAGLATRMLAFAADAVVINVVGWLTAAVVGLCLSLLDLPDGLLNAFAAAGAVIALLWSCGYFVFFWSTTGETLGDRLLRIRVVDARTGEPPRPRRALARFFLLPLSAIPFGLGIGLILVDDRRRALHDVIARTVVIDSADEEDVPRLRHHG